LGGKCEKGTDDNESCPQDLLVPMADDKRVEVLEVGLDPGITSRARNGSRGQIPGESAL